MTNAHRTHRQRWMLSAALALAACNGGQTGDEGPHEIRPYCPTTRYEEVASDVVSPLGFVPDASFAFGIGEFHPTLKWDRVFPVGVQPPYELPDADELPLDFVITPAEPGARLVDFQYDHFDCKSHVAKRALVDLTSDDGTFVEHITGELRAENDWSVELRAHVPLQDLRGTLASRPRMENGRAARPFGDFEIRASFNDFGLWGVLQTSYRDAGKPHWAPFGEMTQTLSDRCALPAGAADALARSIGRQRVVDLSFSDGRTEVVAFTMTFDEPICYSSDKKQFIGLVYAEMVSSSGVAYFPLPLRLTTSAFAGDTPAPLKLAADICYNDGGYRPVSECGEYNTLGIELPKQAVMRQAYFDVDSSGSLSGKMTYAPYDSDPISLEVQFLERP